MEHVKFTGVYRFAAFFCFTCVAASIRAIKQQQQLNNRYIFQRKNWTSWILLLTKYFWQELPGLQSHWAVLHTHNITLKCWLLWRGSKISWYKTNVASWSYIILLNILIRHDFDKWNESSLKFNLAKKANMATVIRCWIRPLVVVKFHINCWFFKIKTK